MSTPDHPSDAALPPDADPPTVADAGARPTGPFDGHLNVLADVLDARRAVEGRTRRARLARDLRALAAAELPAGTADADELRDALALLARSSAGAPEMVEALGEAGVPALASVLDAVATPFGQLRRPLVTEAPAEESAAELGAAGTEMWRAELRRSLTLHAAADLATDMLEPSVDPGAAAALVTRFGYRFEEDGFRTLHDSAVRSARRSPASALRGVSGLAGCARPNPADVVVRFTGSEVPRVLGRPELVGPLAGSVARPEAVQVVVGASGAGKTTLALAVAQRAESAGITVLWIPARDLDTLVDGLHRASIWAGATVEDLQDALDTSGPERAGRLWALLDTAPRRWLAVLDGAGPDAVGHPAWVHRSPAGGVLVTTEHGTEARWDATVVRLREIDERDGARILLDRLAASGAAATRTTRARARQVSRRLAGSALALDRLGSALCRPGAPSLAEVAERSVDGRRPLDYVYDVCLRSVRAELRESARRSLLVLAMLAPGEPLPLAALLAASDLVDREAVGELMRAGLVDELTAADDGARRVSVHGRVAECARADTRHTDADRVAALRDAVQLLDRALASCDPWRPADWTGVGVWEPHVAEVVEHPGPRDHDLAATVLRLADTTAVALARSGRQPGATTVLERALRRLDAVGPLDRVRLGALHTRAWIVAADGNGDLGAAEVQLRHLLELQLRRFAADDPAVVTTRDTLGWMMAEQGRIEEAEQVLAEVLDLRLRAAGPDDRHTLTTRQRLAWVRALRGRDGDALPEFAAIVRERMRQHGPEHLLVLMARYRHAWVLNRLGQHAAALAEFREQLADLERIVGHHHPMTLIARSRLAWCLFGSGAFDDAGRVYRDLLADQEKVFGVDHPRTLATRHDLAWIAMQHGRCADAVAALREVVARRTEVLGPDHRSTLDSRSTLAWAQLQCGQADVALRGFLAVLADRHRVLGAHAPATLVSRHLVARAFLRLGRLAEAEATLRRVVRSHEALSPTVTRNALHARHSLGWVIALRGRAVDGERILREVLADRTRELGPFHRETMVTRDILSWLMGRTGRAVDALEICVELLTDRTRAMGPDHPHTLTSRYRQAWLTMIAGGVRDGRAQLEALLPDLLRALGPDHPDTLRCRMALARAERRGGDLRVALSELDDLVVTQVRLQGPHAVDTLRTREERGHVLHALGRRDEARSELRAVFDLRVRVLGPDHPDTERGHDLLRAAD